MRKRHRLHAAGNCDSSEERPADGTLAAPFLLLLFGAPSQHLGQGFGWKQPEGGGLEAEQGADTVRRK